VVTTTRAVLHPGLATAGGPVVTRWPGRVMMTLFFGEVTAVRSAAQVLAGAVSAVVTGRWAPGPGVGTDVASVLVALRTAGLSGLSPHRGSDHATARSSLVATHSSASSCCTDLLMAFCGVLGLSYLAWSPNASTS